MPSADLGVWSSSGYLLSMNTYLNSSSWFHDFPKVIQKEGEFDGSIYAVSAGENDSGLMYNKVLFKEAGIPVPWKPTTWQDIITAAERIKRTAPSVTPLWLNAGTGSGTDGLLQGINNFIVGSSTPTIQTKSGQMVVDSSGIRAALGFYHEVYAAGLGASKSALFSSNALVSPLSLFRSGSSRSRWPRTPTATTGRSSLARPTGPAQERRLALPGCRTKQAPDLRARSQGGISRSRHRHLFLRQRMTSSTWPKG